jgi:hypothetical protein
MVTQRAVMQDGRTHVLLCANCLLRHHPPCTRVRRVGEEQRACNRATIHVRGVEGAVQVGEQAVAQAICPAVPSSVEHVCEKMVICSCMLSKNQTNCDFPVHVQTCRVTSWRRRAVTLEGRETCSNQVSLLLSLTWLQLLPRPATCRTRGLCCRSSCGCGRRGRRHQPRPTCCRR